MSWKSRKQTCVALFTAEAEYIALAGATQEAVCMRRLLSEIYSSCADLTVIHEESQSASQNDIKVGEKVLDDTI